jgi:hypothetical protein
MDRAIDETRRLINDMDRMLNQLVRERAGSLRTSEIEVAFAERLEPAAV